MRTAVDGASQISASRRDSSARTTTIRTGTIISDSHTDKSYNREVNWICTRTNQRDLPCLLRQHIHFRDAGCSTPPQRKDEQHFRIGREVRAHMSDSKTQSSTMGPASSKDGASDNLIDLGVPASPPPSYSAPLLSPNGAEPKSAASGTVPVKPRGPRPILPLELPALASLKDKRVILASASPRRKLLLAQVILVPKIKDITVCNSSPDPN